MARRPGLPLHAPKGLESIWGWLTWAQRKVPDSIVVTSAWNTGAAVVANHDSVTTEVPVAGAMAGDAVSVGSSFMFTGVSVTGQVSGANGSVLVVLHNSSGFGITLDDTITLKIIVWRVL